MVGGGPLACVEVGGSGTQTVVFDGPAHTVLEGARRPPGARLAIAVPGIIVGHRVAAASNLGWYDVDPADRLGLAGPATVVCNDAEAAALGEAALRANGSLPDLVYVGAGTGVGGAVVEDGRVVAANLFGHLPGYSDRACRCGSTGCLETVAAGWALPDRLDGTRLRAVAGALARAVTEEAAASGPRLVVLAGGIVRRHPALADALGILLADRAVEPSASPPAVKSAAAWGLRRLVERPATTIADPPGGAAG